MTPERRKLLYELYDEFLSDYGQAYTGRQFEAYSEDKKRSPKKTFRESTTWLDKAKLDMDEKEFITKLKRRATYWLYKDYTNSDKRFEHSKNYILHLDNVNFALNGPTRTSLRKLAVHALGYSESYEIPVEKLHELNALVIQNFKDELTKRNISYE